MVSLSPYETDTTSVWHVLSDLVLSDFVLMTVDIGVNSSYIKSFAVDKLLAVAARES